MGFKITQMFPSRFLKGTEIAGKQMNVTISAVKQEKVYLRATNKDELVLVVYFRDKARGVVLKKERSIDIVAVVGNEDTDSWVGQVVCMYTEKKSAGGKMQDCIRFKEALPVQP